jgi:Fe-S-cluster containining protein
MNRKTDLKQVDQLIQGIPPERPEFLALSELFARVDREILGIGPQCELSGRCCRFKQFGHDLFITGLEHDYLIETSSAAVMSLNYGENCPWQSKSGICTARNSRPLGCRVFFCDPAYADSMPEIMESAIRDLKKIHIEADLAWDYRPLQAYLIESREQGRWQEPAIDPSDTADPRSDSGEGVPNESRNSQDFFGLHTENESFSDIRNSS